MKVPSQRARILPVPLASLVADHKCSRVGPSGWRRHWDREFSMTQTPKSSSHLIIYKDAATLASKAAEQFAGLARDAAAKRGRFAVALSGGSTPRAWF
jgi:hypothetical protein